MKVRTSKVLGCWLWTVITISRLLFRLSLHVVTLVVFTNPVHLAEKSAIRTGGGSQKPPETLDLRGAPHMAL